MKGGGETREGGLERIRRGRFRSAPTPLKVEQGLPYVINIITSVISVQ